MALSTETEAEYVKLIDVILRSSDLNTISEKRIRKGLQEAVNHDLTPQKDVIKPLIMARFDKFMAEQDAPPQTNGHVEEGKQESSGSPETIQPSTSPRSTRLQQVQSVEADESSEIVDIATPKKKRKRSPVDKDAAFAAKLQAEENGRSRSTRAGGPKKAPPVKKRKTPKKKTADRIDAADDSDMEQEKVEKKVNRSGGFHVGYHTLAFRIETDRNQKPLNLSTSLSALLDGEIQLSRPQTVKRIWEYVRAHDLQEPNDKRWIRCDDAMKAVFKAERVNMFTMNKLLAQNLYNPDE
ncbi:MAG: hypothetical protein Q9208_001934 [Pyrenodesmia sp. 3 TL-2023]